MTEWLNAPFSWWIQAALIWNLLFAALLGMLLICRHGLQRLKVSATRIHQLWWAVPLFLLSSITLLLIPRAVPLAAEAAQGTGSLTPLSVQSASSAGTDPWLIALGCWLPVAVWLLVRMTGQYRRVIRSVTAGQGHPPGPATSPLIQSAVCLGVLRPRVVVSESFAQRFSPRQQAHLLAHERVHQRRHDPAWRLLAELLRVLCWFNPMIHLAARAFVRDQEMSCDEQVLKTRSQQERIAYARLLGELSTEQTLNRFLICTSGSSLKERLMRIAQLNQSTTGGRLGTLGLLLILATAAVGTELTTHLPRLTAETPADTIAAQQQVHRQELAERKQVLEQQAARLRSERDQMAAQREVLKTQHDHLRQTERAELAQQRAALEVERERLMRERDQRVSERHQATDALRQAARDAAEARRRAADAAREAQTAAPRLMRLAALEARTTAEAFEVIAQPAPKYPKDAAVAEIEGHVRLEFDLMPDHRIGNIRILESVPEGVFDQAAMDAISQWRMINNGSKYITLEQTLEFKLDH